MKRFQTTERRSVKPIVAQIEKNIHQALADNGYDDFPRIKIKAVGNNIVLTGKAQSWEQRKAIAHAAWATPGVAMVSDRIMITGF